MIPRLPYLEFAAGNYPGAEYDLASSNVPWMDLSAIEPDAADLRTEPPLLMPRMIGAIAERYGAESGRVALTPGSTGAMASFAAALADVSPQRKHLLVESPAYEPMWKCPELFGFTVEKFERERPSGGRRDIDVDSIQTRVKDTTAAVWITNSHNPTGTLTDPDRLRALARALARKNVYLFVDEIYLDFAAPLGEGSALSLGENVVITSSLTKVYGLGGLRIGWVIGPEEIASRIRRFQTHVTGIPFGPGIAMALKLWPDLDSIRKRNTDSADERASEVERLAGEDGRIHFHRPDAGIVQLVSIDGMTDDREFCLSLLRERKTVTAPGSFFGAPGTLRLGWGVPRKRFEAGWERLRQHIEQCVTR